MWHRGMSAHATDMQTISTCSARDQVHPQQPLCSMFKSHNSTPHSRNATITAWQTEKQNTLALLLLPHTRTHTEREGAGGTQLLPYVAFNKRVPLHSENCTTAHSCCNLELVFLNERALDVTHSSGQLNIVTKQTAF